MKNLTLTQQDMVETLKANYDCIGKLDALRFLAQIFPYTRERLADSVAAYESVEAYQ